MVIAAFYVIGSDVRAETVDEPIAELDEQISAIEHLDRRLTISNEGATSPCVMVCDDLTHLFWVDGAVGDDKLAWKCSNDSLSTFTADQILTTSFYSITNIDAVKCSSFPLAVVFQGQTTSSSEPTIYFLFMNDDEDWSSCYPLSNGNNPSATTDGEAVFLLMNAIVDDVESASIASIGLSDGNINATFIAALPTSFIEGDIAYNDGSLDVSIIEKGSRSIYYLQLGTNGVLKTNPAIISNECNGDYLESVTLNGDRYVFFIDDNSIKMARCMGVPDSWVCHTIHSVDEGSVTSASIAISGPELRIAYTVLNEGERNVWALDCDLLGNADANVRLSTPGLDARSPMIFSTCPGSFSCIYVEEHHSSQELFLRFDIDFSIADVTRMPEFIDSLEGWMFANGNGSRSALKGRMNAILAHRGNSNEALAIENATALAEELRSYFVSTPYDDLENVDYAVNIIEDNLVSLIDPGTISIMSLPDPLQPPGGTIFYEDVFLFNVFEPINNTAFNVVWCYQLGGRAPTNIVGDSGYLMWGTTESTMTNRVNGTLVNPHVHLTIGYCYEANITGLSSNVTYYLQGYVIDGSTVYTSPVRSFSPYPGSMTISSVSVSTVSGSATISWSTNVKSDSKVEYGTTSSYGSVRYSDEPVYGHSLKLYNLGSSTVYHYRITSVLSCSSYSLSASTTDLTFTSASGFITVSGVTCTLSDLNVATITWTTNIEGTTKVVYGTTTSYGHTITGPSGTSHSIGLTGLLPGTTYHFKAISVATISSALSDDSGDRTFTTICYDADLGYDAGDSMGSASSLDPGSYVGYLDSSLDANDYYSISLLSGEMVRISLDVPSNFDHNLHLYNPSGNQKAASTNGVGMDEGVSFTADSSGVWKFRVTHQSGTGQSLYGLNIELLGTWETFSLDVGASGDNNILLHTPGMAIIDGTRWYSISSGKRETAVNGSLYLSIYDDTYQANTYYEISMTYTSSADVSVSVLVGNEWIQVATLPGRTTAWTYAFILKSDMFSDSSASLPASNVRLRFDHQVIIDHISAIPVAYASNFFDGPQNCPGITLENNWQIGNAVVNGSAQATFTVSLPRTDITYYLEFVTTIPASGTGVQQWDGSAYDSIGTLESWGTSSVIQLDPSSYYDTSTSNPGMNLRLRLTSSLINLTRIVLWTSQSTTDVGVTGDSDANSHTPGISILANGEWSSSTTYDSKTVRTALAGQSPNFFLNGAQSDAAYVVTMTYRGSSGTASLKQYQGSTYGNYVTLGSMVLNGAWQTTNFITSALYNYDATPGGLINLQFEITSSKSVYVDSISVCMDSDGDTYGDSYESMRISISGIGTHIYDLNPFSADTDSDGLNDNVERSNGYYTDPCDPDTDNDGLLDGSERYSYTWSTDDSYLIPDNSVLTIDLSLPAMPGAASSITSLCLVLGIMHGSQYQLEVKVAKGTGAQKTIKAANTGIGANYFVLRNLFAAPISYSASDLETANVWHIYIRDVTAGTQGRVEYARLQVNGTTNPLDNDSDDDSIEDGEEVEFGTDGWYTNPRASDSDSDGVSDRNEIIGDVPCGFATDPTRADTDDDGYDDNVDLYMGDAVLRVTIKEYKTREDVNWGDDDCNIFFVIRYADQELSTKRLYAHTDVLYYPEWAYDIDIAETITSVDLEILAVADNAVLTGDDEKLDVSPSGNLDHDVTWYLSSDPYILSFQGSKDTLDHDTDAYMKVMLERAVTEKAKVIVINGTGEDGDYGLDAVSTGIYRYSADDQVYLVVLNVSGTSSHFHSGMNTIVLPRAIALQCQLNDTLYDLQNVGNTPLSGASFYSTNVSSTSASAHIIAVISKNVTASQAETILTMLTHNATGARVGNNVTISSTALYLLHLPNDILSAIPTSVMNSGMGEGPSFLDPLDTICDIAGMVFDFLVWVATGGVMLLLAHLVKEGLRAISNLVSTAITAVEAAVDRIVDAFSTFVNWIIDLAKNILTSAIPSSLDISGHSCEISHITSEINSNDTIVTYGSPEAAGKVIANDIANSNLFQIILALCICVFGAITIISTLTMPYSALITKILIPFAISMILPCVLDAIDFNLFSLEESAVEPLIDQILGASLATALTFTISVAIATVNALKGAVDSILSLGLKSVKGLIFSIIGLALNVYSLTTDNLDYAISASLTGFVLSVIGFIDIFTDKGVSCVTSEVIGSKNMLVAFSIFDCGISLLNFERMVDKYVAE